MSGSSSHLGSFSGGESVRPKADSIGHKFESLKAKLKYQKNKKESDSSNSSSIRRRTLSTGEAGGEPRGRCCSVGSFSSAQQLQAATAAAKSAAANPNQLPSSATTVLKESVRQRTKTHSHFPFRYVGHIGGRGVLESFDSRRFLALRGARHFHASAAEKRSAERKE